MKHRISIALLAAFLFLIPGTSRGDNAAQMWYATALTGGGTGALDAISGVSIGPLDGALAIVSNIPYLYRVTTTSTPEASPLVIRPDDVGAGVTSWEQVGIPLSGTSVFCKVTKPASLGDPDNHTLWINNTGATLYVTNVHMTSETSGATCSVVVSASPTNFAFAAGSAMVTDIWPTISGTSVYTINAPTGVTPVPSGRALIMDNGSGTPNTVTLEFGGYLAR